MQKKKTQIWPATDLTRHRKYLVQAAHILQNGGLVAFATETVYGVGANALDENAVADIFRAKGRPQDNPLIVHISDLQALSDLTREIPLVAKQLAEQFWPGPLTLVLPRSDRISDTVSAGLPTVAVRMPSHPVALELIRLAGVPIAAPSANRSGGPSPTTAQHCIDDLQGRVDVILDSGPCTVGLESTVINLTETPPRLLRPGAVTPEQLQDLVGAINVDESVYKMVEMANSPASPGVKHKHYTPKARVSLVHGDFAAYRQFMQEQAQGDAFGLVFDGEEEKLPVPCISYGKEEDPLSQAERLFSALRELDAVGAKNVYVRAPQAQGVGLAVYNRLVRAAAFTEIFLQ